MTNSSVINNLMLKGDNSSTLTTHRNLVTTVGEVNDTGSRVLVYILVPLGSLVLVAILSLVVVFIFRKSKLERLRHHLMPMYSFDPAEEDEDWESELLEDQDKEQQVALRIESPSSPSSTPMLKFGSTRR